MADGYRLGKLVFVATIAVTLAVAMVTLVLMPAALFVPLPHPVFLHKVDRLTAGAISPTILGPVLLMSGWHIQIDRLLVMRHG